MLMKQFTFLEFPYGLRLLGLGVLIFLAFWLSMPWGSAHLDVPDFRKRVVWLALLLFLPLTLLWAVSWIKPVYAVGRYDVVGFPAFVVLLGLALWKLQRMRPAGPIAVALTALLLLVPIGVKLSYYYRAAQKEKGEMTAKALHEFAQNRDVVVFTGLRGLSVLYHLHRLGYRWEDGYCRNLEGTRRFGCRLYPREMEMFAGILDPRRVLESLEEVRKDIRSYLGRIGDEQGGLWILFGSARIIGDKMQISLWDARLVQELRALGLRSSPVGDVPWALLFRRDDA